jgi:hypothetical protein
MQESVCATNSNRITFIAVMITAPVVTHNAPCYYCDTAIALSLGYICTSLTTIQHQVSQHICSITVMLTWHLRVRLKLSVLRVRPIV